MASTLAEKSLSGEISKRSRCGINRYVLLVLYCLVVLFRGCPYWGWDGIQDVLYKSGAYKWSCDVSEKDFIEIGDKRYVDCPERKKKINSMCTVAFSTHFISSAFSGIVLDKMGPKFTSVLAVLIDAVGWCIVGFSNSEFQGYYFGMVLIAVASDPGYLSLLSISNLFPKNRSLVISLLGSFRSISFAVPVTMAAFFKLDSFIEDDLWKVIITYVACALGLCLLICLFTVPRKPFVCVNDTLKAMISNESTVQDKKSYFKCMRDPRYLLIIPVFAFGLLRSEYYTKSNKESLVMDDGSKLTSVYSIFNILSFLPGPMFGLLVDKKGPLVVLTILNTFGLLMYGFLMVPFYFSKIISLISFFFYTSFVMSIIYCYLSLNFPAEHFGKLAGFLSMVAGIFVLSSVGLYSLSTEVLLYLKPYNLLLVESIMMLIGIIVYVLIFFMFRAAKYNKIVNKKNIEIKITENMLADSNI